MTAKAFWRRTGNQNCITSLLLLLMTLPLRITLAFGAHYKVLVAYNWLTPTMESCPKAVRVPPMRVRGSESCLTRALRNPKSKQRSTS